MTPRDEVAGAVLIGGRSRRMGTDKASLRLEGATLLGRAIQALRSAFSEVLVVGRATVEEDLPAGVRLLPDDPPGRGPLGGIATALAAARADWVFALAVDLPRFSPEVALWMADQTPGWEAVIPRHDGIPEPLHALYSRDCLARAREALEREHASPRRFLETLRVLWVEVDPALLQDVDTPQSWETWVAHAR